MLVETLRGTAALALVAALAACVPQQNANVLSSGQALSASSVQYGTVTASRVVTVEGGGGGQAAGAIIGGLAGAALGHQVGGGVGRDVATGVGATAGIAAGSQAGKNLGNAQSIQWTVKLDSGGSIAVVQGQPGFNIGQRVQVIFAGDGTTRLQPA